MKEPKHNQRHYKIIPELFMENSKNYKVDSIGNYLGYRIKYSIKVQ